MIIHVVQPGETISSIAELYRLPEDRIILENALTNPDNLVVGQTIVIVYPLIVHTVQEGDTLEDIAKLYQVPLMQLLRNNPYLSDREYIYPGETIIVSYETDKIATISVGGYVYSFINRDILRKTLPFLTFLTVFDYFVNANGEINTVDDQDIVNMAKAYDVFPMMLLSTLSEQGVGNREADIFILDHPEIQDIIIDNVLANINAKGYYGLNQYFQYLSPNMGAETEAFIIKMSNRLRSEGLRYSITITPQVNIERTNITYETIDYSTISQYVDAILFLSFDWGYSFAPSTSATPLNILEAIIRNFTEVVPPDKFALGLSVIGYDWELPYVPGYTVANSITYDAAIQIAADSGVDIQFNTVAAAPYYFYNSIEGALHNVWFKDARSVDQISRLVPENGLQGLFIWNNMYFFTQMWLVINNLYDIVKLLN